MIPRLIDNPVGRFEQRGNGYHVARFVSVLHPVRHFGQRGTAYHVARFVAQH